MLFLASIPDDELKSLIMEVRKHHSQSNPAFEKIEKEFRPLLVIKVKEIISKYSHRGITYDDAPDLLNSAKVYLWETLNNDNDFKIPEENVYQQLYNKLKTILSINLIEAVQDEIKDTATPQISVVTKSYIFKIRNFIMKYQEKHHYNPDIPTIARGTGFSIKRVTSYIDAFNLFDISHLDQQVTTDKDNKPLYLDKFLKSDSFLPEKQYLDKEEKEIWQNAIKRSVKKLEQEIGRSSSEGADIIKRNFNNIITSLIDSSGKNIPRISSFYGISGGAGEKTLSRLWHNFVNIMKHDQELVKYVHATKSMFIKKIASEILSDNLCFESNLIKKVANIS